MTAETIDGIELPTREEPLEPQGFVHQHPPSEARFESEVLPEIDGFERCDHPEGDVTLYCDPEKLSWGTA